MPRPGTEKFSEPLGIEIAIRNAVERCYLEALAQACGVPVEYLIHGWPGGTIYPPVPKYRAGMVFDPDMVIT